MTAFVPTLAERAFPRASAPVRDLLLVIGGSLLVAALAQVVIPLQPVPITGQTFAVLLVGAALGARRGAAALALYLVEGGLGLPFFQGGAHGLGYMFGATGGYLVGFVAAAFVTGWLAERGLERSLRTSLLPFLAGTLVIYLCGAGWLAMALGSVERALAAGVLPFLVGDALKAAAAALVLPAAWRMVKG